MAIDQISIGKYALMTRLTHKALRLYDKKDILIPEEKDPITGYRYYTIRQIEDGIRVKMLASMGFSLEEIKTIVSALYHEEKETITSLFAKRLSETQLEIERLKKIEDVLVNEKNIMDLLKMHVSKPVIKEVSALRVLSKRKKGSYSETIGELINELMGVIYSPDNRRNLVKVAGPIMFICHDDEYREQNAHIEVAIPITGRIQIDDEEIQLKHFPANSVASVVYTGAYDNIGTGYQQLFEYLETHNYQPHGHTRELYLNSPNQVQEEDLLTEIQVPIKKMEQD